MKNPSQGIALAVSICVGLLLPSCGGQGEQAPINSAPWADAGASVTSSVGLQTALDGSGSYDPDDDPLSYHWSFESVPIGSVVGDSSITPNDSGDAAAPSFAPDTQGLYVLRLRVSDGEIDSRSDFVHVMADIEGSLPVADAGEDHNATEGDTVDLDGSGSWDPLDYELTYRWTLVDVPETSTLGDADISGSGQALASFVPDAPGVFLVGLQVNNGVSDSVPDFVSVDVTSTNSCPVAGGEAPVSPYSCSDIGVSASSSYDVDGDLLEYTWRHLLPPQDSSLSEADFVDPAAEDTVFFADGPGIYTVQVSVNDGECESAPFQFDIEVAVRPDNEAPTPQADDNGWYNGYAPCTPSGSNWWCEQCDELEVTIDGSASTDPDGDPLSFYWENLYDPEHPGWEDYERAEIDDPGAEVVTVILGGANAVYDVDTQHQYEFMLTVTDCMGEAVSLSSSVGIVYNCRGI